LFYTPVFLGAEETDLFPGLPFQLADLPLSCSEEQEGNKRFLHSNKCTKEVLLRGPMGTFWLSSTKYFTWPVSLAGLLCALKYKDA